MKVGTFAYATDSGLGILAKAFRDHGVVTDVLVVEHAHHPTHWEWYPNSPRTQIRRIDARLMRSLARSVDVMLFFETPFNWGIVPECRRSVLLCMHECTPATIPCLPDAFLCPSDLDQRCFDGLGVPAHRINVPVEVPWKLRTRAEVFVHNAGHGGLNGRNGTSELLAAWKLIHSPINLIVRTQSRGHDMMERNAAGGMLRVLHGTFSQESLWSVGDVFVFPERHNGLSLPLQEACAAGMLVMAGDRFPMNIWLPKEPLIPVARYETARIGPAYRPYEAACYTPKDIAVKVDEWYGRDISEASRLGREWAEINRWEKLGPVYKDLLRSL